MRPIDVEFIQSPTLIFKDFVALPFELDDSNPLPRGWELLDIKYVMFLRFQKTSPEKRRNRIEVDTSLHQRAVFSGLTSHPSIA